MQEMLEMKVIHVLALVMQAVMVNFKGRAITVVRRATRKASAGPSLRIRTSVHPGIKT